VRKPLIFMVAAVVLLIGGVALASIPDANGVIHGCRKTSGGALRVIDTDAGQTCMANETAINWTAGPASGTLHGAHIVTDVQSVPADGQQQVLAASCPVGEQAVSLSGFVNDTPGFTGGIRPALPAHNYGGPVEQFPRGSFNVYVQAPPVGEPPAELRTELLCVEVVP
jgi:hypothetical protein